ncbi:MAG: hypothetical protein L0338_38060, partial [Acidobacteria bacterium]|nr:hypothetical protein [Acidobacteriota bacterium]
AYLQLKDGALASAEFPRLGAAGGRADGLRPQLRAGRPRSQGGCATPKNVQPPGHWLTPAVG